MELTRGDTRPPLHLTYCTNVHPAHTLDEVVNTLRGPVAEVKRSTARAQSFGVGLRLSAAAAAALLEGDALDRFAALLAEHDYYVFTLNGFPYGAFHGASVKERVYLPDWGSAERLVYTRALSNVLARLARPGLTCSISTVPGAFKPLAASSKLKQRIGEHLLQSVAELVTLERDLGVHIVLALEPEPYCMLETADEVLAYYEDELLTARSLKQLRQITGCGEHEAEVLLRRHLGVCLDTCHAAVEFESPLLCYRRFVAAGILVPKIQVSAGLRLDPRDDEQIAALRGFDESVYLHQVVERSSSGLRRWSDLAQAFEQRQREVARGAFAGLEWRVHFHVPVFESSLGRFASTQDDLPALLRYVRDQQRAPHLEVETYTWSVLPEPLRSAALCDALSSELRWTANQLSCA